MSEQGWTEFKRMQRNAGPFPPEAFDFVRKGLAHTVKIVHRDGPGDDESRHVTGQQLCMGLRDYALNQYGLMARTVLERWHIARTDDFGRIVFAMIDAGLMRKNDKDSMHDFSAVFEFDDAFGSLGAPTSRADRA